MYNIAISDFLHVSFRIIVKILLIIFFKACMDQRCYFFLIFLQLFSLLLSKRPTTDSFLFLGAPRGQRRPQATRGLGWARQSDQDRHTRGSALSCGTTCSHHTRSSRIPPCPPTQPPTPSPSWRRRADGWRRRRSSLEPSSTSKGKDGRVLFLCSSVLLITVLQQKL